MNILAACISYFFNGPKERARQMRFIKISGIRYLKYQILYSANFTFSTQSVIQNNEKSDKERTQISDFCISLLFVESVQ